MNTVKKHTKNIVIWSAQASSLVFLITAGGILGVVFAINTLSLIV